MHRKVYDGGNQGRRHYNQPSQPSRNQGRRKTYNEDLNSANQSSNYEKQSQKQSYQEERLKQCADQRAQIWQELQVFDEIFVFEAGDLDYQPNQQVHQTDTGIRSIVQKTKSCIFAPKFPYEYDFYQSLVKRQYQFSLFRDDLQFLRNERQFEFPNPNEAYNFKKCQILFQLNKNVLINNEHHQAKGYYKELDLQLNHIVYAIDIDFLNIKNIHIEYDDRENYKKYNKKVHMLIEMKKPAEVQKLSTGQNKDTYVRSPMNFIDQWRFGDASNEDYNFLRNYWNINQCFHVYGKASQGSIDLFKTKVRDLNPIVKIYESSCLKDIPKIPGIPNQQISNKQYNDNQTNWYKFIDLFRQLGIETKWSMLALVSNDKLHLENWNQSIGFMKSLLNSKYVLPQNQEYASYIIDFLAQADILNPRKKPTINIFEILQKVAEKDGRKFFFEMSNKNINIVRQRHIFITPTLIHVQPGMLQESNKVLRKYNDFRNDFLKVSFTNEYLQKGFYFSMQNLYQPLLSYIHLVLTKGFSLGFDLRYNPLSYSNSQIKNHSTWFLRQDPQRNFNIKSLIQEMGDLSSEKSISKFLSRFGQNLATTQEAFKLQPEQIQVITDIVDPQYQTYQLKHGLFPSDGCGYISPQIAEEIAEKRKIQPFSAIQIRTAGAKGILVVNKQLNEKIIQLRESQIKFKSDDLSFDICRINSYSQGYLNNQMILLLFNIGVPYEFFLEMQADAVKQVDSKQYCQIKNMLEDIKVLQNDNASSNQIEELEEVFRNELFYFMQNIKFLNKCILDALFNGMDLLDDPILSSLFYSKSLGQKLAMKQKNRIQMRDSCSLMGVIDSEGVLEEGELFVQIEQQLRFSEEQQNLFDKMKLFQNFNANQQIIKDKVLVTRSPSVHPGDIQLFTCVDRPELHHLTNVVVFSQKGERPDCNKMSCGDLDGDNYFICWNQKLLQYVNKEDTFAPAPLQHQEKEETVQVEKIDQMSKSLADFFTYFLERDLISKTATTWLKLCQLNGRNGPDTPLCKKVARMHQVALDFAKHGKSVRKEDFRQLETILKDMQRQQRQNSNNPRTKVDPTKNILTKLGQHINLKEEYENFIKLDWQYSILQDCHLDFNILKMSSSYSPEWREENKGKNAPEDNKRKFKDMLSYLLPCVKIIEEMTQELKLLMENFLIVTEGELFTSDMKLKINHMQVEGGNRRYVIDSQSVNEDAFNTLQICKNQIIDKFKWDINQFIDEVAFDPNYEDFCEEVKRYKQSIQSFQMNTTATTSKQLKDSQESIGSDLVVDPESIGNQDISNIDMDNTNSPSQILSLGKNSQSQVISPSNFDTADQSPAGLINSPAEKEEVQASPEQKEEVLASPAEKEEAQASPEQKEEKQASPVQKKEVQESPVLKEEMQPSPAQKEEMQASATNSEAESISKEIISNLLDTICNQQQIPIHSLDTIKNKEKDEKQKEEEKEEKKEEEKKDTHTYSHENSTKDYNARINVSVALYFATYFNLDMMKKYEKEFEEFGFFQNSDFKQYVQRVKEDYNASQEEHKTQEDEMLISTFVSPKLMGKFRDFKYYLNHVKQAEKGDRTKLTKLLNHKKLYSIPWLLADKDILQNYPDQTFKV